MTATIEEEELSEEQNGFRKNRRTEHLYISKELKEEAEEKKKNYTACS